MKRGEFVIALSRKVVNTLKPFCKKIQIAGSIRRGEKNPRDIDIVLILKDKEKLENAMNSLHAKYVQGGEKESTWKINRVKIELYYTTEEEWGAALLAYSSRKGSGIGLRIIARTKGFKLNSHGLFNRKIGKKIAGKTEKEIYKALGRNYKNPEDR